MGKIGDEHGHPQVFFTPRACFGHPGIVLAFCETNRCVSYFISIFQPTSISGVFVEVELAVGISREARERAPSRMQIRHLAARSFR